MDESSKQEVHHPSSCHLSVPINDTISIIFRAKMKGVIVVVNITLSLLLIPWVSAVIEDDKWNERTSKDDVLEALNSEELFIEHRRLQKTVNECFDGSDFLNWDGVSDGVNLLRLYFECECTGDLGSFFSMKCEMKPGILVLRRRGYASRERNAWRALMRGWL